MSGKWIVLWAWAWSVGVRLWPLGFSASRNLPEVRMAGLTWTQGGDAGLWDDE